MKILLLSALLLTLTGCGITSSEKVDQQIALIEYEACLQMQESNRVMLIDELSRREGAIPDVIFENFSPTDEGEIAALESARQNCANYRP
jgi:hypothetical protein